MDLLNNFFPYVLSVDFIDIMTKLQINDKNKNLIYTMRNNFGRFWNLIGDENNKYCHIDAQNKLLDLYYSYCNFNIDKDILFNSINKLVKFSDNVSGIEFAKSFYGLKDEYIKEFITNDDDKSSYYNFKHNIVMFWLGLNEISKNKLFSLMNNFFDELSEIEKNIIFNKQKPIIYDITTILKKKWKTDVFDESKPNVIIIKNISQFDKINILICEKEKLKSSTIDTLALIDLNLSEKNIVIPFQIKNIKINKCSINNLDWLHDGIEYIYSNANYGLIQLDNLPSGVKILICKNNIISNLNCLPNSIEYLNCENNKIEELKSLPKSLEYLNCKGNSITNLTNLPIRLKYLNCSKNSIIDMSNLPNNLIWLDCSINKLEKLQNLPENLEYIDCHNNIPLKLTKLPEKLRYLNTSTNNLINLNKLPFGITQLNLKKFNSFFGLPSIDLPLIYSPNSNIELFDVDDILYDLPNMLKINNNKHNLHSTNTKLKLFYNDIINKKIM